MQAAVKRQRQEDPLEDARCRTSPHSEDFVTEQACCALNNNGNVSLGLLGLPHDLLFHVMSFLDSRSLFRMQGVCRSLSEKHNTLHRAPFGSEPSLIEKAAKASLLRQYAGRPEEAERWHCSWVQRLRIEETVSEFDMQRCQKADFTWVVNPLGAVGSVKLDGVGPKLLVSEDSTSTADFLHWRLELRGNNAVELGVIPASLQDTHKALHKCVADTSHDRPVGICSAITVGSLLPVRVPLMKGSDVEILVMKGTLDIFIRQPSDGFEMTWMNSTTVPRPYVGPKQFRFQMPTGIQGPVKLALTCWAHAEFCVIGPGGIKRLETPGDVAGNAPLEDALNANNMAIAAFAPGLASGDVQGQIIVDDLPMQAANVGGGNAPGAGPADPGAAMAGVQAGDAAGVVVAQHAGVADGEEDEVGPPLFEGDQVDEAMQVDAAPPGPPAAVQDQAVVTADAGMLIDQVQAAPQAGAQQSSAAQQHFILYPPCHHHQQQQQQQQQGRALPVQAPNAVQYRVVSGSNQLPGQGTGMSSVLMEQIRAHVGQASHAQQALSSAHQSSAPLQGPGIVITGPVTIAGVGVNGQRAGGSGTAVVYRISGTVTPPGSRPVSPGLHFKNHHLDSAAQPPIGSGSGPGAVLQGPGVAVTQHGHAAPEIRHADHHHIDVPCPLGKPSSISRPAAHVISSDHRAAKVKGTNVAPTTSSALAQGDAPAAGTALTSAQHPQHGGGEHTLLDSTQGQAPVPSSPTTTISNSSVQGPPNTHLQQSPSVQAPSVDNKCQG